jgi:hypothetical protein
MGDNPIKVGLIFHFLTKRPAFYTKGWWISKSTWKKQTGTTASICPKRFGFSFGVFFFDDWA